jgi:hypothetical protein
MGFVDIVALGQVFSEYFGFLLRIIPLIAPNSSAKRSGGVLHINELNSKIEVNLRTMVSRPVCLDVRLRSGAHDQIFFISLTFAGFLMWVTLSDERMGL